MEARHSCLLYPPRPAWCEVDTTAIAHNTAQVCRLVAPARLMAVVKADGFGHGLVESARAALLGGATHLAVAILEEGVALRRAGLDAPVVVLGTLLPRHARAAVAHRLEVALCTADLAEALDGAGAGLGIRAAAHVKVDTGLRRIGLAPEEVLGFFRQLRSRSHLEVRGVFSTLADPEAADDSISVTQYRQFMALLEALAAAGLRPPLAHLTDSPLVASHPEMNLDAARVGRLLYGLTPWQPDLARALGLRPCLSIRSEVVFVKSVPAGVTIGFDRLVSTGRPSRIATLPLGFADVGRLLSAQGEALIHGMRAPVISVASDQCLADVTDLPEVEVGDEAVLLGRQGDACITLVDIMARTKLSGGTLCTGLTRRLAKVYLREGIPYRLQSYLQGDP
jgi:alanine racemase